MPSDHRPATRRRSTVACLALACVLIVLVAVGSATASTSISQLIGWDAAKPPAANRRAHPDRRCRAQRCCRVHKPSRFGHCARAQGATRPVPILPTVAPSQTLVAGGGSASQPQSASPDLPSSPPAREESSGEGPPVEVPAEEGPTEEELPAEESPGDGGDVVIEDNGPNGEAGSEDRATEGGDPLSSQSPPLALSSPTPGALTWAPPTLVNPKTIKLGTGYTHTSLSPSRDYIIKLPATRKVGGTWLDGGHNVVVIGGYITVPQNHFSAATNEATALSIKGATGTVHVEGVLIDGSGGGEFDGVTINAPEATVQLENLRIVGVRGCNEKIHADVVQPWGGVKDLRIDRLTGKSTCQGLTIKPDLGKIGSAEIDEVDLTAIKEEGVTRGGHMLWLTRGMATCDTYPMKLSNLYVTPLPGDTLGTAIWPQENSSSGCPASGTKGFLGWPALPLSGGISSGAPSAGSYVPDGVAGLTYRSPGYRAN